MKIGFLGPQGSYSFDAAKKYKKIDDELVEYSTIFKVIDALEKNKIDECIVPIENAIQGSVLDTIDSIFKYKDIYIIDEIILDINHKLMSKTKNIEIAKIYSHPQALAQCRNFLNNNYGNVEQVPVSSTSYAAKLASNESNTACICNDSCGKIYNLVVLEDNIQDIDSNQTKFIVLSKEKNTRDTNKTSIIFSTKDEPGALYKILGIFSVNEINLTKIESRPAKTRLGEYMFFVDIEGDEKSDNISRVLSSMKEFCEEFRVIGSY